MLIQHLQDSAELSESNKKCPKPLLLRSGYQEPFRVRRTSCGLGVLGTEHALQPFEDSRQVSEQQQSALWIGVFESGFQEPFRFASQKWPLGVLGTGALGVSGTVLYCTTIVSIRGIRNHRGRGIGNLLYRGIRNRFSGDQELNVGGTGTRIAQNTLAHRHKSDFMRA
jgi:hypothetical protein